MQTTGTVRVDVTAGPIPGQLFGSLVVVHEDGNIESVGEPVAMAAGDSFSFGPVKLEYTPLAAPNHGKTPEPPKKQAGAGKGTSGQPGLGGAGAPPRGR